MGKSVLEMAKLARDTAHELANIAAPDKNRALKLIAAKVRESKEELIEANRRDLALAKERKLPPALIERLSLTPARIEAMCNGLENVASLPDPVGEVIKQWKRPNGLKIEKVRVPIGVIGVIYESRPNVTVDVAGLTLKAGNAVILRGGSEAINSNLAIYRAIKSALRDSILPQESAQMIKTTEREAIDELLKLDQYIDLIIPRGGEELMKKVVAVSTIPVIKHYKGVCHTYVDKHANLEMAEKVSFNAKVQRPGVCNAMETLLVHAGIAEEFLPRMLKKFQEANVEIRGCPRTQEIFPGIRTASEDDWSTEYLDLVLAVKVVGSVDAAIDHINAYGSSHSDAIITESKEAAQKFLRGVDSAAVYLNASTRFTDGGEFGMGAEIGISTDKIGARGPMGLEELTSYKFIVYGKGQTRE